MKKRIRQLEKQLGEAQVRPRPLFLSHTHSNTLALYLSHTLKHSFSPPPQSLALARREGEKGARKEAGEEAEHAKDLVARLRREITRLSEALVAASHVPLPSEEGTTSNV